MNMNENMKNKKSMGMVIGWLVLEIVLGLILAQVAHLNRFFNKIQNKDKRVKVEIIFCIFWVITFPIISLLLDMP